ncbi:unnamed protein product (macronuclear) [Paramecium tetraurelia]|uniref:Uncharacterized protein n=1 Tax=Paramecium tetraurelia TaxID=5888 RepID=A0DMG6_PARTE|nr:uncharacterized protein GSPATT00018451001 [Paramecium tetraurelia]CAK84233.1 unnamed protein product [Paramecium tetraurelia]|eukprot:XP_001451630.1 hypothetical protein (macronuclear) [Paramecium tetraurelia strain d4-2]
MNKKVNTRIPDELDNYLCVVAKHMINLLKKSNLQTYTRIAPIYRIRLIITISRMRYPQQEEKERNKDQTQEP